MFNAQLNKSSLRRSIREAKRSFMQATPPEERRLLSEQILACVEQMAVFRDAKVVLAYYSLDDELFTHDFVQRWADRKTLLLPKVQGDSLTLHRYIDSRSLGQGAFGIMEPCTPQFTNCSAVDLVIVPGLAFDAEGNRLGRGRGYYDRLFAELLPPSVYKVGVCYPFQMVPQVPTEPTDITMDEVIARSA